MFILVEQMNKKHVLTVHYNDETDIRALKSAIASLIFTPYRKGKKYEQSAEINAKIPILQMLQGAYWQEPFQKYLDVINNDILGFASLVEDIVDNMQKLDGNKFEITFEIKKVG